jgi:hypothetical protein
MSFSVPKAVKFTPLNAIYLSRQLMSKNVRDMPTSFVYGQVKERYTLLCDEILGRPECPFREAKHTTLEGTYMLAVTQCILSLLTLVYSQA